MSDTLLVQNVLGLLLAEKSARENAPPWPPDLFAVVATLLESSGGYCRVSCNWPPDEAWTERTKKVGRQWRTRYPSMVPARVDVLWMRILGKANSAVMSLRDDPRLCADLLELLAIADQASMGVGVPMEGRDFGDAFDSKAELLMLSSGRTNGSDLCDEVCTFAGRVLPKMHAPQSGLNLRSLSHHLAFVTNSEIRPYWQLGRSVNAANLDMTILLLPWPLDLKKSDFKQVAASKQTMRNLPLQYGFFEFRPAKDPKLVEKVIAAVAAVSTASKKPDLVVLPECALTPEEFDALSDLLLRQDVSLIAGVRGSLPDGTMSNSARFNVPLLSYKIPLDQPKHHRWKLDGSQIEAYGLSLPKDKLLWEHIPISDRKLTFVCAREWLALCVLVCEDLARPDPVGDVIRAVGPNLVIALLLDGPQIESRWSGRYATALADDPGSSVLTLTCRGMSALSNPPHLTDAQKHHGKVALWKDVRGRAHVVDVKDGDSALLHIRAEQREEFTADGRSNNGATGYPLLKKVEVFQNGRRKSAYDV